MKNIHWMIAILFLVSCGSQKTTSLNQNDENIIAEHIWDLQSIGGKNMAEEGIGNNQKLPFIQFRMADKQMAGNDGCNHIMADIENLSENEIKLGPIMGTKMACMDMKLPDLFHAVLAEAKFYQITAEREDNLFLHLFDQQHKEILVFKAQ